MLQTKSVLNLLWERCVFPARLLFRVLCASTVNSPGTNQTTEAQSSQRTHRDVPFGLCRRFLIGRRTVDRGNFAAHRPQVCRQLASMMNRVEEYEPEKYAQWLLHHYLALMDALSFAVPTFVVDL